MSSRSQSAKPKATRQTPLERALTDLAELAAQRRATPIAIGRILAQVTGADRDAAAKETGLARRSAYYLATIAKAIDAGLMSEADATTLGWTRARTLAAEALRSSRKVPSSEIRWASAQSAKAVAAGAAPSGPSLEMVEFVLKPRQASMVRRALEAHGAPRGAGPEARAGALAEICRTVLGLGTRG